MEIAIIKSGGKQYKVKQGDELAVELLDKKKGEKFELPDMLDDKKVSLEVVESEIKGPKILNIKFKNKTRYSKRIGHRQKYTKIKVLSIK